MVKELFASLGDCATYRINNASVFARVDEKTGVARGTFTETFVDENGEQVVSVNVRFSGTYKLVDGRWKRFFYHPQP